MNPYQHIVEFVEALRKEGFQTGVDTYLQVAAVCRALPPDAGETLVCDYLCPLFAADAAGQKRFRDRFPNYAHLLHLSGPSSAPQNGSDRKDTPPTPEVPPPNRRRYFLATLAAVLMLGAALAAWWYFTQNNTGSQPIRPDLPPIDTTATVEGCMDPAARNYNPQATIPCADCCTYERPGCRDPKALNYDPEATTDCTGCCRYAEGVSQLQQQDSVSAAPRFAFLNEAAPDITPLPRESLQWPARYKNLIGGLLFVLLFGFAMGYFLWRRMQQRYLARQSRSDEAPYRLPIKIRHDRPIVLADEFPVIVNRLKGRELAERLRLHVPRTVAATVQRGGLLTPRFQALSRPVEYVLLIDKNNEQNHQAQLFEYLYQHLLQQEVYAERYFFDGTPLFCWNDQHPAGLPIERVLQRHGDARLLVLGDGYSFINPATGELEDGLRALAPWKQRALLTPAAMAGWNYREAILSRFFFVLPSSLDGIVQVVRHFEALPTPSLRDWKYELGSGDRPLDLPGTGLAAALHDQIGPDLTRWVTACAVYPELHWDLTLELGDTLSAADGAPVSAPLLSFQNVATLARLPWFRQGYMPPEVRSQLLSSAQLAPEERKKVRGAIVRILEANAPANPDSYAAEEHRLHLALNRMLVAALPAERRKWLERYRELHGLGVREDNVSMVEVDRHFNKVLDFPLPQRLLEALFPSGRRVLGWRSGVPLAAAALLAAALWGLGRLIPQPCPGTTVEMPDTRELYCLQTPDDSLAFNALQASRAADRLDIAQARRWCEQVRDWAADARRFPPQRVDTLFDLPLRAHLWNSALQAYNRREYRRSIELLRLLRWSMALRNPGAAPPTAADPAALLYAQALEAEGISHYFLRETTPASAAADSIAAYQPGYFEGRRPNLRLLLDYDYVDTLAQNRIRVRRAQRYGFLDERGMPLWRGNQLPYDHAFHFRDGEAVVTVGQRQCRVSLDCQIDPARCVGLLGDRQGRVLDAATGNPVANATVRAADAATTTLDRLRAADAPGLYTARTDARGRYTLQGLPAVPQLLLYAEAPGYDSAVLRTDPGAEWPVLRLQSLEAADWARAKAADTPEAYGEYLAKHPNGANAAEARRLQTDGLSDRERNAWEDARKENTIAAYETYLRRYPNGAFRAEADTRIVALRDAADWQRALQTNTIPAYEAYLNAHPQSPNADEARRRLYSLREAEAWARAVEANTREAYETYLRDFPEGPNAAEAKRRMGDPGGNKVITDPLVGAFVLVKGGTFTMGCKDGRDSGCNSDEKPDHQVTLKDFYIGQTEVTQAQWRAVMGEDPPELVSNGCDDCPVESVSWDDIQEFISKLNARSAGTRYRLPTEAEWEYAARGGAKSRGYRYAGSNNIGEVAWYERTSGSKTQPVKGKNPNELGLYDMSGNVWEWCADWYGDYSSKDQSNPTGPSTGSHRVFRGGSWPFSAVCCRPAARSRWGPGGRGYDLGFRLAASSQ